MYSRNWTGRTWSGETISRVGLNQYQMAALRFGHRRGNCGNHSHGSRSPGAMFVPTQVTIKPDPCGCKPPACDLSPGNV